MQEPVCPENYPAITVIVSNLVSFLIYGIGAYILLIPPYLQRSLTIKIVAKGYLIPA